jgi:CRP-like cAMP-binding protein
MQNAARREQKHQIEIDRRVAALRMVSIFEPLTEPERRELAEHLTLAPFREGEVMTRQGALAHHLSIMVEGTAEVLFDSGNNSSFVSTLKAGDVFGEMGLLTGEARTATVLATSDCVCYKLDRTGFAAALQRRPELAEEISKLLTKRKQELEAAKAGIHVSASTTADTQRELLKRIRNFFRLE